jgi:antitoxin CptB
MLDPKQKARLFWHCRRGMLELDLILQGFFEKHIDNLTEDEIKRFDLLLNCTDPELLAWLMGHEDPQDEELIKIVTLIRSTN